MPLNIAALKSTPGLPGAGSNGAADTPAIVATRWANAVGAWAAAIVPPSTAVAAAKTALQATLTTILSTGRTTAPEVATLATALEAAHLTFATAVGAGMAPAFTPTPPVGTIGFADILTADARDTSQDAADAIADALDPWMKTGLGTPPSGPAVNWS